MGIQGLLPLLKSIHDNVHISAYANQRVAVDTYVWLHRGTYTCATELCLGQPTEKYLDYCLGLVDLLLHYKVTPVMVFDGACLPQKKGTEVKRRSSRQSNKAKGRVCYEEGNHSAAMKFFQKAVDITPAMAHKLIHHLRLRGVEYIVAPYEADAQLAFLSISNYVAAAISEDSDLLVFGCKRVLYKMDKQGHGVEIRLANIAANEPYNFANWTQTMLQLMAVLSGCDYLPSLDGMGIKKAYQEVQQGKTLERILARLRADARFNMPPDYEEQFKMAIMTFNYQRVFDPISRRLVSLHPLPPELQSDSGFLGPVISDEVAEQIARGEVHPDTHRPFDFSPDSRLSSRASSLSTSSFRRSPRRSPPRRSPPRRSPPRRSVSPDRNHCVSDFFNAVAEYKSGGSNASALFPGLEPLPSVGSTTAAQRPFVRPAVAFGRGSDFYSQASVNSSDRWTELFHESRGFNWQANKENERAHINLLEDDDEPGVVANVNRLDSTEVYDEKIVPKPRAPRVGLAKSSLISSRSRLTVPRTSGLLGAVGSTSGLWPGPLSTFTTSSTSVAAVSASCERQRDIIDTESPISKRHTQQREIVDITSPSPKRLQIESVCSPMKHKQKLARVEPWPDVPILTPRHSLEMSSPTAYSASSRTSQASSQYESHFFNSSLLSPTISIPSSVSSSNSSVASFYFNSAPPSSYSKAFDYAGVDDCPSPCSEVDEDALTPSSSPRSPFTTCKSRSTLSPPTSPTLIYSPICRRFSFEGR